MTQKSKPNSLTSESPEAILALTEKLYKIAAKQIATGQAVGQENFAIANRARIQIGRSRKALGLSHPKE